MSYETYHARLEALLKERREAKLNNQTWTEEQNAKWASEWAKLGLNEGDAARYLSGRAR